MVHSWCWTYLGYPSVYLHCMFQVTVREADQEWIFGEYICRARNNYGTGNQAITLHRASKQYYILHFDGFAITRLD